MGRIFPAISPRRLEVSSVGLDRVLKRKEHYDYAAEKGLPIQVIKPRYDLFGKKAPLLRNRQIVECADLVIAIWDGESTGTAYTIDYAHERGVPVRLYIPPAKIDTDKA